MSGLVTGDAVVLGLQPARLPSRALAIVIDLVVVWTAYLLVSIGLAVATASLDEAAVMAVSIATFLLVPVGAPIAVETLSHGRSLGKLACGLRVVRDDGGPIRFRHALVRGAMGVVEILMTFGVIACIASLVSARGRRIGDVFAGTLVVRERVPAARGALAVPPPPPWLVGRFSGLDLSGVPDDLWLAIRQYLTRMRQLDAAVSWSMAQRLAGDLSARTGTPAPEGVPPAAYLAAVVNERQARDARRVFAAAARSAEADDRAAAAAGAYAVEPSRAPDTAGQDTTGAGIGSGPESAGPAGSGGERRGSSDQGSAGHGSVESGSGGGGGASWASPGLAAGNDTGVAAVGAAVPIGAPGRPEPVEVKPPSSTGFAPPA
ncbi:putative RDD family membrane protein YckC [Streptomyces sp. V4I23]|uniref:RDD family protein n=1 Tax=Streptomyces sp. V4I23 TaxID=3042282 RepID=UPI00278AFFD8|nr:RDD family protein [Streptomyces sp. V4I23]MDQ1010424.1 putative RDD family membrane protein YckC [Streptomyces sp. V4I23]